MDEPIVPLEEETEEIEASSSISLPFHLITLILGLWKRRNLLIYVLIPLFIFAVIFAKATRTRMFTAQVLLLYDPPPVEKIDAESQLSLYTLIDLIKNPDTIDIARTKINLPARINTIAAAIDIELRPKTTLLEIKTEWDDARIAADLANATYEAFFDRLTSLQGEKRTKELNDLTSRLKEVKTELTVRDQELQEFTLDNKIVDLDIEAVAYLQQLVALDTDYDREISNLESVKKQRTTLEEIVQDLKNKVSEEAREMAAQNSSVTESSAKVQRLRQKIFETQDTRAKLADLSVKKEDLKRATKLRELDAISQSEFDKIKAEYARAEAMSLDTDEILTWKEEIKKLDESIVPSSGSVSPASAALMQNMMMKSIDLQLEATATAERATALDEARRRAQTRLNAIPQVKQAYAERLRRVDALVSDRKSLQEAAALLTRQLGSSQIPFRVISRAEPAAFHKSSDTKLIFILIFMLGSMAIGSLVVLLELLDLSIKSRGSLAAALPAPPLAVLTRQFNPAALLPGSLQPADHAETYRRSILELKRRLPDKKGCILLITGTVPEAGATTIALNLAARLQDEADPVLLIDAHAAPQPNRPRARALSDLIDADPATLPGMGDYLNSDTLTEDELLQYIPLTGTNAIICSQTSPIPDLLNATRLPTLLHHLKTRFSYILIDAPSLATGIDAELLAQYADAAIYVVKSGQSNLFKDKKAYSRLEATGVDIVGTVLVDVRKPYENV